VASFNIKSMLANIPTAVLIHIIDTAQKLVGSNKKDRINKPM
jgi:hypothetical protein